MIANLTNVSLLGNGTDRAEADSFDPKMQLFFGTVMLVFGLIGLVGNVTALYAFCSSRRLRRPKNYVVANLCLTDLVMCLVYCPVIVFSSFSNRLPSHALCMMGGVIVGAASIAGICSLTAIAVERYFSITQPMRSLTLLTQRTFLGAVAAVWIYSLLLVFPPLVGWGRYVREYTKISCTFDYLSTDIGTRSYVSVLVIGAFGVPLLVIGYCYIGVFTTVRKCEQRRKLMSPHKKTNSEIKTAVNSFIMTTAFCLCWCPYATVAIMGISGMTPDGPVVFGAALLAKLSVIINPIAYVLSNPSFRKTLLFQKGSVRASFYDRTSFYDKTSFYDRTSFSGRSSFSGRTSFSDRTSFYDRASFSGKTSFYGRASISVDRSSRKKKRMDYDRQSIGIDTSQELTSNHLAWKSSSDEGKCMKKFNGKDSTVQKLAVVYTSSSKVGLLTPAAAKRLAGKTKSIVDLVTEYGLKHKTDHRESWV